MSGFLTIAARLNACRESGYSPESLLRLAAILEATPGFLDGAGPDIAEARVIAAIRDAADPATRSAAARLLAAVSGGCACSGDEPPEPTFAQEEEALETLARKALAPVQWRIDAGRA